MNYRFVLRVSALIAIGALASCAPAVISAQTHNQSVGIFEDHGDVGTVLHQGSARYDSANATYTITSSGENMWFGVDDFQFVWKKMSGDVAISANDQLRRRQGKQPPQSRPDDSPEPRWRLTRCRRCTTR